MAVTDHYTASERVQASSTPRDTWTLRLNGGPASGLDFSITDEAMSIDRVGFEVSRGGRRLAVYRVTARDNVARLLVGEPV